jgi:cell division protein FtsI (penicillin-binding protein 3)
MYFKIRNRLYIISFIFLLGFSLLAVRLIYLQMTRYETLRDLAWRQHAISVELPPERGRILDRNLNPLATNLELDSLFAQSRRISNKKELSLKLAGILSLDEKDLFERLCRDKNFVWLARKIPREASGEIKKLKNPHIGFKKESKRFYPNGPLGVHLIGFVGMDNYGLEGLEFYYDGLLKGKPGMGVSLKDAKNRQLVQLEGKYLPPANGHSLVLTIDSTIQYIVETHLDKAYKAWNAQSAVAIVMDPKTGQILAMASRPNFDPNFILNSSAGQRKNRAISDMFEPGSVFKIVAASAALEEGRFNPQDKIFCERGSYRVAGHTLNDHRPHGWLTFREVIEKSSNIGAAKIAQALGSKTLYKYIKLFGFGELTGIDLPGEARGIIRPPSQWSGYSIAAIPMGQEVAVTAIQLSVAFSSLANGGYLVKPYVVKEIRDENNEIIREFTPEFRRRVISERTSQIMREILAGVVETGTGKAAKVAGFKAAGKTGTAQKVESGRYSHTRFVASFAGFVPAQDPTICITVVIDSPGPYYYGGIVAAPVFSKIASDILAYLKVPSQWPRSKTVSRTLPGLTG